MKASAKIVVRSGPVSLTVRPHKEGWRFTYVDALGKRQFVTRRDKDEAVGLAKQQAIAISSGKLDFSSLTREQGAIVHRVLRMGLTLEDLDRMTGSLVPRTVREAVKEFMDSKRANKGLSERNVRSLSGDLGSLAKHFEDAKMSSVTVSQLRDWLNGYGDISKRRRKNLRGAAVTFFRWARKEHYVHDNTTAAERLDSPIIVRKVPETYTAEELKTMLAHCPQEYMPWLVISAFAGVRLEEQFVDPRSDKSPLDWADFDWTKDMITIRTATAKTKDRRKVPIFPALRAWLKPLAKDSGRVCPMRPPHRKPKKGQAVTTLLGAHIGGWKANALRHSFISYRAAQVGLARAAMEAGNTESETKKSYNDAKTEADAEAWFSVLPVEVL